MSSTTLLINPQENLSSDEETPRKASNASSKSLFGKLSLSNRTPVDDYLKGSSVAAAQIHIRIGFLRKVFGILAIQLIFTVAIAGAFLFTPGLKGLVQQWSWMLLLAFVMSIGLLIAMMIKRHETPTNYILLLLWTVVEAYTVGVVVSYFDQSIVLEAFVLTTAVVVGLFMYTWQTKRDFGGLGSSLFAVVWILLFAGIIQMFLLSEWLEVLISAGGAIVFSLFIIYDMQQIMYRVSAEEYIMATINLYLDIINLFIYMLRLLNVVKRDG